MATGGCETFSDEIVNIKCTSCAEFDRNRDAVKYCVECQGYCCQSCTDMHKGFPALKGHQLLDKSSFKSSVHTSDLPTVPTERCARHAIKIIDMYCGNHDAVGCTTCMSLEHRTCTDVQSIPDVIDTIFETDDANKTYQTVIDKKNSVENIGKTKEHLLQELNKSKIEAVAAVKSFRKEMEDMYENLEKQSLHEVDTEFLRLKSILEQEKKQAENEVDIMKHAADDFRKADGNKAQQFVSMKNAQKKLEETDDMKLSMETHTAVKIEFTADPHIRGFFQKRKNLGRITGGENISMYVKPDLYTIKQTRQINIHIPGDDDPTNHYVYGSCFSEDGQLLFSDYSNNKLKRLNIKNMSVIDHCDIPGTPVGVCCTSKQEVAVGVHIGNLIQFVSLGKQMTRTRQLKMNHSCFGIAYKNDRLYVSDYGSSLYIYNMTGSLLQTVTQDSSVNSIFSCSQQIAISESGDNVYVASCDKSSLITLDVQGQHISTFTDSHLKQATGVCTDGRGNVFVCGWSSNNVIQLGQDGKKIGEIALPSGAVQHPESVCFDPRQCTLYVTQRNNNTMKIFDLQ